MEYFKGCPSSLTKFTGNLHILCKPLRQAFYSLLGVDFEVEESFIEWDPKAQEAYWTQDRVRADSRLSFLLKKDPIHALHYFLPDLKRPSHATDLEWNNHIFGLASIICCYYSDLSGIALSTLLQDIKPLLL
jgi:hypothetical protein